MERHLGWDGCFNARDLGGLPTADGRVTRRGAVVRSEEPSAWTRAGWDAVRAHGVRTILDLRNDDEVTPPRQASPRIATVRVPLDDTADTELWNEIHREERDGTPLYFRLFLERKPERCAAAVAAVARAREGGVLVHCVGGRDRTGLVALLLLALAGVEPEAIADDYEESNRRLPAFWAARGWEDQRPAIDAALARRRTTSRTLVLDLLASVDIEGTLRRGGLTDAHAESLRTRLVA